jgi:hypothetical protein
MWGTRFQLSLKTERIVREKNSRHQVKHVWMLRNQHGCFQEAVGAEVPELGRCL